MASAGDPLPSTYEVVKSGLLTTVNERKSSLLGRQKQKSYYWEVLKRQQDTKLVCYKDKTKSKAKETINLLVTDTEVKKHETDNILCIQKGKQVTFLRAENRQQRNDWYETISGLLNFDNSVKPRARANTETTDNRPPIRRHGRKTTDVIQSSPSGILVNCFTDELKKVVHSRQQRPLPSVPVEEKDDDLSKIREPYCCVRHHLVAHDENDTNFVDLDAVYENIHYVRSNEQWIAEVEERKNTLQATGDMYSDFSSISALQHHTPGPCPDPIYEYSLQRREPEENDERVTSDSQLTTHSSTFNNLNRVSKQYPGGKNCFNVPVSEVDSRQSSISSNEDNTAESVRVSRPLPPLPLPTGQALQKKTDVLRKEQRKLHGITKTIPKSSLIGDKIQLMEMKDGIWVIGWDHTDTLLRGELKVGDQLIKINKQALTSANFAKAIICSTDDDEVTVVLKRIPHAIICTISRQSPQEDLGIKLNGNEITELYENGLAARLGCLKPQGTGVTGHMCNWAITEINTQPVDLFATADRVMQLLHNAKNEVTLILQPVDFIQLIRDNLHPA